MAGNIYDWSTTAGANATADDDINWAEGQFPSTVNNSARQMMARVAQWLDDNGCLTVTGTNTIAVTTNSPILAIATGMTLSFRAAATNTTAVTLNVNGLGGKDIRKVIVGGSDSVALDAGDINIKGVYVVHYDETTNGGAGGWILLNPATSAYLPLTGGTIAGNLVVNGNFSTTGSFEMESTDAGATLGPVISLYRNSASPAASDSIGSVDFNGEDSAGNKQLYARIVTVINDPTAGSEDSAVHIQVLDAGLLSDAWVLDNDGNMAFTGTADGFGYVANSGIFASDNCSIFIRPNGLLSTSGQATINNLGHMAVGGNVITNNARFTSSAGGAIYAAEVGAIFLRPNGTESSVGAASIDTAGNFIAAGNITAFSDRRLKSDIQELTDHGVIIDGIEGKRFTKDGSPSIGFIAQDVREYLPELVSETATGLEDDAPTYLSLAYPNMIAVLWNEVRSLRKRIAGLEAK